ncbi:uncharacterized protein LOC118193306 isoform X2 [Stegodyphus dumicola]|nr:uncharacterized protein LOC118193306 isoform X2 [Stegodyphus dumicola]
MGRSYQDTTRDIIRERPHLRKRLSAVRWREMRKGDTGYENGNDYDYAYSAMPDYVEGYTGHIPTNLWSGCERDNRLHSSSHCTIKAYPLSCTEFNSPCLNMPCEDACSLYSEKQGHNCGDHVYFEAEPCVRYPGSQIASGGKKACCGSCAEGEPCEGEKIEKLHPCLKVRFQEREFIPYRKGGVIPNYMGHIPGMQHSFGESYGIAAHRLLQRHFKTLGSRYY